MEVAGFIRLKSPNNISFIKFIEKLKSDNTFFEIMEYNVFGRLEFVPNDPAASINTSNQWYLEHINAYGAWNYTMGSSNIIVAVLDEGIDVNHEDIGNGLGANIYTNIASGGWNFGNNTANVTDNHYHGTFVSGIISAKTNNGIGIAGIAGGKNYTGVKILPLKLVAYSASEVDLAIRYAINKGARIINMSFWTLQSPTIDAALQYAADNNVFLVKSAGNNGYSITYPGTHPEVFVVGATDINKKKADFSSYGSKLNVVAPGKNIYSTTLVSKGQYAYSDGTSFAAPQVSGIAALILSVNPNLTQKQVANIIEQTAQKTNEYSSLNLNGYIYSTLPAHPNGTWNNEMGYGLVDAYEAVRRARSCWRNVHNRTIRMYTQEKGCVIDVKNTIVKTGHKLLLNAKEEVNISSGFELEDGAELEIFINS